MAPNLDRETARALVDAGYMPLKRYVELYGYSDLSTDRSDRRWSPPSRSSAHSGGSQRRKHKTHKAA
jgi:hypothetical protein